MLIEYIDQGWFLGRTLKFCRQRYKMSDEHKRKISESAKNQFRVGKGEEFPKQKETSTSRNENSNLLPLWGKGWNLRDASMAF